MAPLDLHVWGPAFGLASIDAECLAAIAYLRNALPPSDWRLVPSSDPSRSRQNHLPALYHDGVWVSGYGQIVGHLASLVDLNRGLDASQLAHVAAFSTFLHAHAAPLVHLSLYVSAANWSAVTRPAYSAILPFPITWTVPPLLRAEAIRRVHHLGLADLDSDLDPTPLNAGRDALPEALRRRLPVISTKSVRDEMTPEQATAIRLVALIDACLPVLEAQLQGSRPPRFVRGTESDSPSSLDCLAYGYLALMLKPDVPRAFIRDWALTRAPRLTEFVDAMTPSDLPWFAPEPPTLARSAIRLVDSVVRNLPTLGEHYADEMRLRARRGVRGLDRRIVTLAAGLAAAGLAVGYGYHAYRSLQPFGAASQVWMSSRARPSLTYGQLGSMLGSALGFYQVASTSSTSPARGRLVEVDSEEID
ncbi:hypothetical protein L249_0228 [Ophiocordyceps polyrhachis-furcata BCC 54312]|uniref:Mitochondrial outer membrane transport complex Sam37/metaxin N-terminal domain-containing protein n=1 Tax=Ophiocordyceps polyrhachis-furcata BCC 54312 TaxID=1330021 RepID=A0A367LF81_9HYPO|nr:hypothetical protein L249_0228 [Ophiocordyceps polyrhachis-furcata BCC 54312]